MKQGGEGTPVAEIVYVGPQPHHLEGCSFKGGFGGKVGGIKAHTTSPPATVSRYWPSRLVGLTSDDENLGLITHALIVGVSIKEKYRLRC